MKVHRINLVTPVRTRYVFTIDPGFKTSGFAWADLQTGEVRVWGAKKEEYPIQGVPLPELFRHAYARAEYYLGEIPGVPPEEVELIIEYTVLHRQFSTSLNVLISTVLSLIMERHSVGRITLVQPRTSQWFLKLKSAKPREIRTFVENTFPQRWSREKRWNTHASDALLIFAFCHIDFFKKLGIPLREPSVEWIERTH